MRYEWKYIPTNVYNTSTFKNVLGNITWYCVGTAPNGAVFKTTGVVDVPEPTSSTTFVDFTKLTKPIIEGWVFSAVDKTNIETQLQNEYNNSLSTVTTFNF